MFVYWALQRDVDTFSDPSCKEREEYKGFRKENERKNEKEILRLDTLSRYIKTMPKRKERKTVEVST